MTVSAPRLLGEGSSPHARGKRRRYSGYRSNRRLIPACAGKTDFFLGHGAVIGAHPRMRGENTLKPPRLCKLSGSSPHARGKHPDHLEAKARIGLIPACAGKTVGHEVLGTVTKAHPRMRGENYLHLSFIPIDFGSSPHARGKQRRADLDHRRTRLIPACAGKTAGVWRTKYVLEAHPRMRGENEWSYSSSRPTKGSSPHARGKLCLGAASWVERGLIPACAGKTKNPRSFPMDKKAHPRMRGENRKEK